eukprot:CAMPEP_0201097886 /NCGR_PEP_ID=MMETSP0812-20130820/6939_1 /ASSEMBLY_ACC=CAM_ASM_000668 /TAXON_ID=98059 /ORGANISM="Dinobryon sp., Strain UTEXLB2267" /LENGTH=297 /DNA_ID=CAMNT_0047353023 /DNA_START=1379 /DNA_END=2270 /DNA_ORIENTATION=+
MTKKSSYRKRVTVNRYRKLEKASSEPGQVNIQGFALCGTAVLLILYIAINVVTLLALSRRFTGFPPFEYSNTGSVSAWDGMDVSSIVDSVNSDKYINETMNLANSTARLGTIIDPESLPEAKSRFRKASALLEERVTEESFYQRFYSISTRFDKRDTNRTKLSALYLVQLHQQCLRAIQQLQQGPPPQQRHHSQGRTLKDGSTKRILLPGYAENAASGRSAFAYPEYETGGEVFQYEHRGYGDRCLLHAISLKMDRNCGDTVLLQLDIHYESLGSDGGIGWMFAVNTFSVKARKFLW